MVGNNKKECEISDKENNSCELNDSKKEIESSNKHQEKENINGTGEKNNRGESSLKERTKSVTLVENIKSRKKNVQIKKDNLKKQNGNTYLKGILKIKHNNPPVPAPSTPKIIQKTEEIVTQPCPRYFGIKSYIDSFYYPPDAEILNSGEYIQDDFEFIVEPGKRRWRNCWFKVGLWGGINLLLLGIIALLVGHLTHPRETVVARVDNLEILDRSAIMFNSRLQLCRLAGITIFCIGGIILMLTLLISSYQQESTYYVMNTAFVPDIFTRTQGHYQKVWASRIPLTGTLKPIQPR